MVSDFVVLPLSLITQWYFIIYTFMWYLNQKNNRFHFLYPQVSGGLDYSTPQVNISPIVVSW